MPIRARMKPRPIHPSCSRLLATGDSRQVQRTRACCVSCCRDPRALGARGQGTADSPASVPVDAPAVQSELTRYLPPVWDPIIEKVSTADSLPLKIDRENPMWAYSAARRVAHAYLGRPTQMLRRRAWKTARLSLAASSR